MKDKLSRLSALFVDKRVRITSDGRINVVTGRCIAVHATPGVANSFNIEIKKGSRYGFTAETITDSSVEGPIYKGSRCRHKIQLI